MVVAIDLGEWNDVHPTNKKAVGHRLALVAQRVAYGDATIVASGPNFQSARRDGRRMILAFSDTGGGFVVKGSETIRYFALAGSDRQFVWAKARIENDEVAVWHDGVAVPVYTARGSNFMFFNSSIPQT